MDPRLSSPPNRVEGFRGWGFRVLGFRVLGFRGLAFKVLGFSGFCGLGGFRVLGLGKEKGQQKKEMLHDCMGGWGSRIRAA